MSYEIIKKSPVPLAAGEISVLLDTGETVAAKVSSNRLGDGGSVYIVANCRQIDPKTANTELDANGKAIACTAGHTFDAASIKAYTVAALSTDMLLLVLGEPTLVFGEKDKLPPLDQAIISSASIREEFASAAQVGDEVDPAKLLGAK